MCMVHPKKSIIIAKGKRERKKNTTKFSNGVDPLRTSPIVCRLNLTGNYDKQGRFSLFMNSEISLATERVITA